MLICLLRQARQSSLFPRFAALVSSGDSFRTSSLNGICTSALSRMPTIGVKRDKLFEKLGRSYSEFTAAGYLHGPL